MERTKHRRDAHGLNLFREAQSEYLRVLRQQNDYWRQRAKQFWLAEGDTNSRFFHSSVRRRKQNNSISRLKGEDGSWVSRVIQQLSNIKVDSLMNMQKDGWENDILKDLFSEADVSQILSIPVAETKIADHLIWMGEKKGNFSVSSCYKMLQSNHNDDPVPTWSKMWKLRLPPKVKIFCWQLNTHSLPTYGMLRTKQIYTPNLCQLCGSSDENSFHLFVCCGFAKDCWELCGGISYNNFSSLHDWIDHNFKSLDDGTLCKLIIICWAIWRARNDKVWNHKVSSPNAVVDQALIFLQEWTNVHPIEEEVSASSSQISIWSKPPTGYLKINVDAGIDFTARKMGLGMVIRDSDGDLIAARMIPWPTVYEPGEAEALTIREALKWIKSFSLDRIQVESDCLQVVNAIHNCHLLSSLDLLVNDILVIARDFSNLSFSFVKRSANRVAHTLARKALSMSDCMDCLSVPFPCISHVLDSDHA